MANLPEAQLASEGNIDSHWSRFSIQVYTDPLAGMPAANAEWFKATVSIPEEKSKYAVPGFVLDKVNGFFSSRLPEVYGSVIPPLLKSDVIVFPQSVYAAYQREDTIAHTHPLRVKGEEEFSTTHFGRVSEIKTPLLATQAHLPGRPIVIGEEALTTVFLLDGDGPEDGYGDLLARYLMHEEGHRITTQSEPISVSKEHPLFQMAFASDLNRRDDWLFDPVKRQAFTDMIVGLQAHADQNNSFVVLDGASVTLFTPDENGDNKIIARSGYDLNEVLVEVLIQEETKKLVAKYEAMGKPNLVKLVSVEASILQSVKGNKNILLGFEDYLGSLGLSTPDTAFEAYRLSQIPQLHAQLYGNSLRYFT